MLTDQMTRWATPRRAGLVVRLAAQARTLSALGHGDFEAAYQHAAAITPAGELAGHVPHALWLTLDLTEAAVRSGRPAEAAAHVAAVRQAGVAAISPRQALIVEGAAAIAAPDDEAAALFERALAVPGADRWPFDRARIQLTFGERRPPQARRLPGPVHLLVGPGPARSGPRQAAPGRPGSAAAPHGGAAAAACPQSPPAAGSAGSRPAGR